jgi:spermidine/putrescine transport system substrate-binding protein
VVQKKISRGRFLKAMGAAGVAGSTLSILACQPNTTAQSSGGGEGGGPEEKELNLYNWSDYMAPSTIPSFEEEIGIQVTQDFYASNEELLAKLQRGATGYDVIVPSDYMVAIMTKSDVIQPLDKSKIPNFKNVGENFRGLSYDPDNEYSMPYQWGTTGILYNIAEVGEVDSWDAVWDPEFEGRIGMLNDTRETLGVALYKLGYSVNATDEQQLREAEAELKKQKPLLRGYFDSTQNSASVQNGNLLLGHTFSGDAFLALSENKDLDYAIPQPAATRWTDNMCIPAGAQHPDNAHKFINYVLDAEVGAKLSNYTYYNTPNKAALPMVDEALKKLPGYNPQLTPKVYDRLEVIRDTGETTREYERIFTEVKSA